MKRLDAIPSSNAPTVQQKGKVRHYEDCNKYLDQRKGTYEFRCRRYMAVLNRLHRMGLEHGDLVIDLGAGRCEFGRFMREQGWNCHYLPYDGSIDGVDLDRWTPKIKADFYIAIEFIEHLTAPFTMLGAMYNFSNKGAAITTPNPYEVDVLAMDPTHKVSISVAELKFQNWFVDAIKMFTEDKQDTLVAYKSHKGSWRIRE